MNDLLIKIIYEYPNNEENNLKISVDKSPCRIYNIIVR